MNEPDRRGLAAQSGQDLRNLGTGLEGHAAIKADVEVLTHHLANELGARKISANIIAPGALEADLGGGAVRDDRELNAAMTRLLRRTRVTLARSLLAGGFMNPNPSTTQRVTEHTSEHINARIRQQTEANVQKYGGGDTEALDRRLEELQREWDIERALEANAATLTLFGAALALGVHRRFALLPLIVGGFLLQHALQGWCPPLPLLRRLGLRTQSEIEEERYALKALRGDFRDLEPSASSALARVRA